MNITDEQNAFLLDAGGSLLDSDPLYLPDHLQADRNGYYRARDEDYAQGAAFMRRLNVLIKETVRSSTTRANARCPECGGPAERVFGRNSNAWITYPLGCKHGPVYPASPERSAARERAMAALSVLPPRPALPLLPTAPEVPDHQEAA